MNKLYEKVRKILGKFESSLAKYRGKLDSWYNNLEELSQQLSEEDPMKKELENYIVHFKELGNSFAQGMYSEGELESRNKLVEMIKKFEDED